MSIGIENDLQFEVDTIVRVDRESNGGWAIERKSGWSLFMPSDSPIKPKVGMTARFYGRGIGHTVRGLTLADDALSPPTVVFYRTEAEEEAWNKEWCEAQNRAKREEFAKNREKMDAEYDALPEVLRRRIDKFRANNPDFRWDFEPYEMFCCKQAVVIFDTLKTKEAIERFRKLDSWQEQKAMVPGLADGHSGNTFGCACTLAWDLATIPENTVQRYGALAPLVGSKEYGCIPRDSEALTKKEGA